MLHFADADAALITLSLHVLIVGVFFYSLLVLLLQLGGEKICAVLYVKVVWFGFLRSAAGKVQDRG